MSFRLFIIILVSLFLSVTPVQAKSSDLDIADSLVIVIASDSLIRPSGCHPEALFSIAKAVVSHVKSGLELKGYHVCSTLIVDDSLVDTTVQRLLDNGFKSVLQLKPAYSRTVLTIVHLPGSINCFQDYELVVRGNLVDNRGTILSVGNVLPLGRGQGPRVFVQGEGARDELCDSLSNRSCGTLSQAMRKVTTEILSQLPSANYYHPQPSKTIPTVFYVDSSYIKANPANWQESINATSDFASRQLDDQFGWGLNQRPVRVLNQGIDQEQSFQENFERLSNLLNDHSDTLRIVIYNQPTEDNSGIAIAHTDLGRAQIGHRLILLEGQPDSDNTASFWLPVDKGLNLLHEIGHVLGAIHVSDINSVMYSKPSWQLSTEFDPVNRQIVTAALNGNLRFDRPLGYLASICQIIDSTSYYLVDYPAMLTAFLFDGRWRPTGRLVEAGISQSFLAATEGYIFLSMGQNRIAARKFRLALTVDSLQASLFYYLSRSLPEPEAEEYRCEAVIRGYHAAAGCGADK